MRVRFIVRHGDEDEYGEGELLERNYSVGKLKRQAVRTDDGLTHILLPDLGDIICLTPLTEHEPKSRSGGKRLKQTSVPSRSKSKGKK
jgi:hypothetical protein